MLKYSRIKAIEMMTVCNLEAEKEFSVLRDMIFTFL